MTGQETGFFADVWSILTNNYSAFISGTITTLTISITATVLGFFLGLLVAIARGNTIGRIFATIYITIFRGTPMIVQAMVVFYGPAILIENFSWSRLPNGNLLAAILIVTVNTGAYMAETIRGGIQSLDKGQFEAAKSLGLTRWQTMVSIILPQAIRNVVPAIGNELIVNIKDTAVLNVISVTELFFVSNSIAGSTYQYFQTFTITSLIYLTLTTIFTIVLRHVEKRMAGGGTRRYTSVPTSQTDAEQLVDM